MDLPRLRRSRFSAYVALIPMSTRPSTPHRSISTRTDGIQGTDSGRFGWYLRSERWGRGYATEATRLLLDFSFSELHRATMRATADPDNLASLRVLQKLSGLTSQGPPSSLQTWRGTRPIVLFTIEAEEWRTRPQAPGASEGC